MTAVFARGEMSTIILPMQAVVLGCMVIAFLGGLSLISAAYVMRDSRDPLTQDQANVTFGLAMATLVVPLLMVVACMFIYASQGGFQ